MDDLRLPTRIYIGAVAATAVGGGLLLSQQAAPPRGAHLGLALALACFMAVAWLFPLPFAPGTKLYLDTSVLVAAVLLFDARTSILLAAIGTLFAQVLRRQTAAEAIFNTAQTALQAAAGVSVLALLGWSPSHLHRLGLVDLGAIAAAGATMYLVNTVSLAGVISLQSSTPLLRAWVDSTLDAETAEAIAHLSQIAIGLLAALLGGGQPWAVVLLLLPSVAVYHSVARHLERRRGGEERRRETGASLTAAHRSARLGRRSLALPTGWYRRSEERFRLLGVEPAVVAPGGDAYLGRMRPAQRLKSCLHSSDAIARLRGDEFRR